MLTMSAKLYALALVGVLLGGCLGYGLGLFYTPPFLEGTFPDSYKERLDDLTQGYLNLSSRYDVAVSEIDDLDGAIVDLEEQLDDLEGEYVELDEEKGSLEEGLDAVSDAYFSLSDEHEELTAALNETQESYDTLLMQYMIVTNSSPLSPQTPPEGTIRRDFAWVYGGETWTLTLSIPEHLYYYYSNKTRVPTEDYSVYVTHPGDDEYVSSIIERFDEIVVEEDYDETQKVNLMVAFVQSLPYTTDDVTTDYDEYPRYPLETLVEGGGDCEDTSILACALLDSMGLDVVLINPPNHVAVGVAMDASGTYWTHKGIQYFYVETTGEGWEIGEVPEEHQGESAFVYPVQPVPIITHGWTASTLRRRVTLVADVQNVGTAEATGVKLFAAFELEDGLFLNPVQSNFFDLGVGEETTVMLEFTEPPNMYARIVVRILDPFGFVMDESNSAWFDTD
jgi:hypothetical protein